MRRRKKYWSKQMNGGSKVSLALGFCVFAMIVLLLGAIYLWRLWLNGFPQRDLEHDQIEFTRSVLPLALLVGMVCGLANQLRMSRSLKSFLRSVTLLSIPVVTSVLLFDKITSEIGVSNLFRGLFGCGCAFFYFLTIKFSPQSIHAWINRER